MLEYGQYRSHPLTKYMTEYQIMGNYGYGWDVETATSDLDEHRARFQDYIHNGGGDYRPNKVKVPNPDFNRFRVGQVVKIHPETPAFAQGFAYGRVAKIGRMYVTVEWTGSEGVSRKFTTDLIAPEIGT